MELHNLKSTTKRKSKSRVGRGPGSGTGKTSTRGQKGQNARSGGRVRPGFEGGQNPLFRRIPKFGFTNVNYKEYVIINVEQLNKFKENSTVGKDDFVKAGYIKKNDKLIKILGNGKLSKKINVKAHKFSNSAKESIEKNGGKAEVI